MKPLLLVLFFVGLLVVAGLSTRPQPQPADAMHPCRPPDYYGDISDNDRVGSEDAMLILREVTNAFPHTTCPADPDCDGSITARDALLILRHVAQLTYSQAEPCPDIGSTPEP